MTIQGMYKDMVDKIGSPRDYLKWVAAIVVATVGAIAWANANYVTTAQGNQIRAEVKRADDELAKEIRSLAAQVQKSNDLVLVHMDKHELDTVLTRIRENETQTFNLQQFIRVNGSDSQTAIRMQKLKTELKDLEFKKGCIINHIPLCD